MNFPSFRLPLRSTINCELGQGREFQFILNRNLGQAYETKGTAASLAGAAAETKAGPSARDAANISFTIETKAAQQSSGI
jgi:hypothetical protein